MPIFVKAKCYFKIKVSSNFYLKHYKSNQSIKSTVY